MDKDQIFSFQKSQNTLHQFIRFIFTASIALSINTGVLYLLTEKLELYYLYSDMIGFMMGMIFNYFMCVNWVFANRNIENKLTEFVLFVTIGIGGLILDAFFMLLFTEEFGIYYIYSKLITLVIIFFYSFFVRKILLFK